MKKIKKGKKHEKWGNRRKKIMKNNEEYGKRRKNNEK